MPLVANSDLPSFARLREEGERVLSRQQAVHQDIRELHIGLLNMMPDKALAATERQFFRLVGGSNQIAQFHMHPFTLSELPRSESGNRHVRQFYQCFEDIRSAGLDALIITGANVIGTDLSRQDFWQPLTKVVDWAWQHVTSTLCSCLATHAVLEFRHQERRHALSSKRWGVFAHRVIDRKHPLVTGVNTRFDAPHSRYNDVLPEQFNSAGLRILATNDRGEVHLAVSQDGLRQVFFQGHPEYDTISLMKEYKREVGQYIEGGRKEYPGFPEHYFSSTCRAILEEYRLLTEASQGNGQQAREFPDALLSARLDNTWRDTAGAIINNWLGMVYQLTDADRHRPFLPGIDSDDPLGLASKNQGLPTEY